MAGGPWGTGTWDGAEWDGIPVTGVTATGGVGTLTHSTRSIGITGVQATGAVGTESDSVTVSITGTEATGAAGNLTAYNPIIVDNDTHDGDKRRTKLWKKDQEAQQRRKASLIATYEDLYEAKPKLVEDIVKSYTVKRDGRSTIDFDKLLANVDKVETLYREHQELDDEEVMLLL